MKKILVTGGAGFIGSHLCKKLLDNNNDVLCIDNYFTGTKENISELFKSPYFEAISLSIIIWNSVMLIIESGNDNSQ